MPDRRTHNRRLQELLPSLYDSAARGSVLGVLLDSLAGSLARFDVHATEVLRDRWVTTATGRPLGLQVDSPLELLGDLLDLPREPAARQAALVRGDFGRTPGGESTPAYRRRVRATARILMEGLTSPRAVLELAALALGAELCPRLQRSGNTTTAIGVDRKRRRQCTGCDARTGRCLVPDARLFSMELVDGPPEEQQLDLQGLEHGDRFLVLSGSRVEDVPRLALEARSAPLSYPLLESRRTHQQLLFAGRLSPGDRLEILPARPRLGPPARPLREATTSALATVIGQGVIRDVSHLVFFSEGAAFDSDSTRFGGGPFAGSRFSALRRKAAVPAVRPGRQVWQLRGSTRAELLSEAAAGLPDGLDRTLVDGAPDRPTVEDASLTLEWLSLLNATFQLSIPRTPAVREALDRGRDALLRRSLDRARAAGVRARLDFPLAMDPDALAPQDRPPTLSVQVSSGPAAAAGLDVATFDVSAHDDSAFGP